MNLLALDTSSLACSVALQIGDDVSERYEEQPREHTRLLVPMIKSLLDAADMAIGDLDAIVLGNGPGSFIGMRIATSVAQGLAHGADLQIVPVSSMAAVAVEVLADDDAAEVVVAQDAHMSQVYLGIYERDAAGLPMAVATERLHGLTVIDALDPDSSASRVAAGQGWRQYPELLAANRDRFASVARILHPRAVCLLSLGAAALRAGGAMNPEDIQPAYLRHKVAAEPRGQP